MRNLVRKITGEDEMNNRTNRATVISKSVEEFSVFSGLAEMYTVFFHVMRPYEVLPGTEGRI